MRFKGVKFIYNAFVGIIMKRAILFISVLLFIFVLAGCAQKVATENTPPATTPAQETQTTQEPVQTPQETPITFSIPKKTPHYESNVPFHASILAGVPINVVINFNYDVANGSSISIQKDSQEYGTGEILFDSNNLAMRRAMKNDAPNGVYLVNYKACWPDGSCHDGYFQFAIDRAKAGDFTDFRNESEVTISLEQISFKPRDIIINKGTKVTWVNNENVPHTINSDPHAGHNYFSEQNSGTLNKGDEFSLVLGKEGIYPYHCSYHASTMKGSIIVE